MERSVLTPVVRAFETAWRLLWPFLAARLIFSALSAALIAPAISALLWLAIQLSGQPALTDFDIAGYLLSPVGFVALVVVASVIMATAVLGFAFMMAIAEQEQRTGTARFMDGPRIVLPDLPRLIVFAGHLFVRVVLLVAPFALAGLWIVSRYLGDYDINYYLTYHPPEFQIAVGLGAVVLLVLVLVALPLLAGWAAALPLTLFEGYSPSQSFGASRARIGEERWRVVRMLAVWGLGALALNVVVAGVFGVVASLIAEGVGADLKTLAATLGALLVVYLLISAVVTALTNGALAVLVCEIAGWPAHDPRPLAGRVRFGPRAALIAGVATVVVAVVGVFGLESSGAVAAPDDDVLVIAHRGAAGARPENTMAAMQKAIEDGADFMELDVQESAEGEVIVAHDSDFMKLAGVDLKVWDATAEDLAQIDIGSWFDPSYADERTPTLREVLELPAGATQTLIELKYYGHDVRLEERVAEVVEMTGSVDRIAVMSLKYDAVRKMKALRPDWSVGLLAATAVGALWELEADFLAVNSGMATPNFIESAQAAGKPVYVWTVNDPLTMSRMISLGVDGLITDEPALARDVLAQRKTLGPAERLVLALADTFGIDLGGSTGRDASP